MNRSKDLDTVAPDDEIVVSKPVKKIKEEKEVPIIKKDLTEKCHTILGHTKSPLSAFLVNPKTLTFSEQDDNEHIYLAVRPHWATNLSWICTFIIMLFVPLFFRYFSFLNFFPIQYRFSAVLFWYLITFIYTFEKFLSWYFDLFLITSRRIVDINFNNLLNKHFAEADLSAIQDVSSNVRGVLATFFNFGNVLIQTASSDNQIIFEEVPNPEKIIKLLSEIHNLEEEEKRIGEDYHG